MLASPYAKLLVYVLTAVFGTTGLALFDGTPFTVKTAVTIGITVLTAAGVWGVENDVRQPWAKFLVGLIGAVAQTLNAAWGDFRFDPFEIQALILAVLGFLAIGAAENVSAGQLVNVPDSRGGAQ